MTSRIFLLVIAVAAVGAVQARDVANYKFPEADAVRATVLGAGPGTEHAFVTAPEIRQKSFWLDMKKPGLERFPALKRRGVHRLEFSLAYQKTAAPLLVSIAGTGGDHASGKAAVMKNIFFNAGYHVLSMTSPSNADFIFAASSTNLTGITPQDAADLYAVIQAALDKIGDRIEVTEYYLTGYSLGGLEAGFVAELDDRERKIGFTKVLMVNPPVNLLTSVSNLDQIVAPGELVAETGSRSLKGFTDGLFQRMAEYFKRTGRMDLSGDSLYKIAEGIELTDFELRALVRIAFGLSTADIVFTSDVMNKGGYVVPVGQSLGGGSTVWFKRAMRWTFVDYFERVVLPYWQQTHPEDSQADAVRKWSLLGIEEYLRSTRKISVIHNRDDIILGPGDIDFLDRVMGDRAIIYPLGGHLGNMTYERNVDEMLAFFDR